MSTRMVKNPKVVSRKEWLSARKELLAKEKRLTRERDAVVAERRQLPWVKVEKNYVFDGPNEKVTLAPCSGFPLPSSTLTGSGLPKRAPTVADCFVGVSAVSVGGVPARLSSE